MGDKLHLKLNNNGILIVYKYREGKLKRTLKRELKGTEIAEVEVESFDGFVKFSMYFEYVFAEEYMVKLCGDFRRDYSS